jgi:hypothetical protein
MAKDQACLYEKKYSHQTHDEKNERILTVVGAVKSRGLGSSCHMSRKKGSDRKGRRKGSNIKGDTGSIKPLIVIS